MTRPRQLHVDHFEIDRLDIDHGAQMTRRRLGGRAMRSKVRLDIYGIAPHRN
jgi:hypothetical protein